MKKYDECIMEELRQRKGLEPNDKYFDDEIMSMSKEEALDEICTWNGLIGFGSTVKTWVEEIYRVNLDDYEEQ